MRGYMLVLDEDTLRVLRRTLDNWHFWRAGEIIDEDDRRAALLEAEIDRILEEV
jgi:hypothetical protein